MKARQDARRVVPSLFPLIPREWINNKIAVSSPANVAGIKGLFEVLRPQDFERK